jgi:uncharacterized protein
VKDSSIAAQAHAVKLRSFALELTKGCNLRCGYCYYADREDAYQSSTRMSPEVAEKAIDVLLEQGRHGGEPVRVHFFGGEPLLNKEALYHATLYGERRAAELGVAIRFEVTTNGTRLDDEVIAFLNGHRMLVGVSFDGPPEIQDDARPSRTGSSYAQAVPGIQKLLASRAGTDLEHLTHCSVVLTRRSFDWIGIAEHLEGLGFKKIILTPATDLQGRGNGYREEDLPALKAAFDSLADDYERRVRAGAPVAVTWFPGLVGRVQSGERREHFCGGGRDYLGVAADGKIGLCYRFFEQDEYAMGSVQQGLERGLTERLLAESIDQRTVCSSCWARYYCGGGCHHDNLQATGSTSSPNPIYCETFRHAMGRAIELWASLSRSDSGNGERTRLPNRHATGSSMQRIFEDRDRPARSRDCTVRNLDGEQVVYEPSTHEVVVLNPTAAFIFERCDGVRTVADLLSELEAAYAADSERLRTDLLTTLTELSARGLLC